jgi:hypothetical protein
MGRGVRGDTQQVEQIGFFKGKKTGLGRLHARPDELHIGDGIPVNTTSKRKKCGFR